ncbi:MAG: hypothetical protein HFG18_10135 [Oscillospiraceae bacterium]|nr:hypothetical protein [Oscillospiraceae bacterium]MCI9364696.1 hypothetical protein [Oscillospiraceae bacterium]MCI9668513.1 hypothetical protein [Oscillospiraceae bacterium]
MRQMNFKKKYYGWLTNGRGMPIIRNGNKSKTGFLFLGSREEKETCPK